MAGATKPGLGEQGDGTGIVGCIELIESTKRFFLPQKVQGSSGWALQEEQAVGTGMYPLGMAPVQMAELGTVTAPLMPEGNEASLILLLCLCFSLNLCGFSAFDTGKGVHP